MSAKTQAQYEAEIERNYKYNYIVNLLDFSFFFFGASFIAARTILPIYVSHLTDSAFAIGLLATIVSTGWLLPQIFTSNWVQKAPIKKVIPVRWGFLAERVPVFLLVPAAWLATKSTVAALVAFFILTTWRNIGAGIVAVGWQDMIAKLFPQDRRGRFFGTANFGGTASGVIGAAVAGSALGAFEFPYNYMICFGAASVLIFISWIFLSMTKEPAYISEKVDLSQEEYWKLLPEIIHEDKNFRRYLISQIIIYAGGMAMGFLAVFAANKWIIPDSIVGGYTAIMMIFQAITSPLYGWLADRKGHKIVIELGTLSGLISFGLAVIVPSPFWYYAVFAFLGASMSSFMISGTMIMFEFSEPDLRPTYIGLGNTVLGIVSAIMPMLGGAIANWLGYETLFIASVVISVIGLVYLRWVVKEPRGLENEEIFTRLTRKISTR